MRILDALDTVSHAHQASCAQMALAWLIAKPAIAAAVSSATSLVQLDELVAAARLQLGPDSIAALDSASATEA